MAPAEPEAAPKLEVASKPRVAPKARAEAPMEWGKGLVCGYGGGKLSLVSQGEGLNDIVKKAVAAKSGTPKKTK